MIWVIVNKDDDELYWSNEWGWGDYEGCEHFTFEETEYLELPIGGKWELFSH